MPQPQEVLDTESINALFEATFEAVEEAICKPCWLYESELVLTDIIPLLQTMLSAWLRIHKVPMVEK